jgi:uncharacterized protein (TIGR00375 family)
MNTIIDLHIHGRFSQATSKNLSIETLEKWARVKGIDLLGTGDFTHPKWIKEIKEKLTPQDDGILKTKSGFPFMLQTELSLIYSQDGKGRRNHNIVLAPNLEVVEQITDWLLTKGRIDYDGRPIFKIPCPEFVESLRKISKDIEVIPAHAFTPWFSMYGSKSGFNSIKDCFQDQTKHIHALESGLSSDPADSWRIKELDKLNVVSFSDSHSFWPWRLGREATIVNTKPNYKSIVKAIRTGKGLDSTIEVDPNYGKYHFTGHRACDVCMGPVESKELDYKCPKCGKEMTRGVAERIEELADRPKGYVRKGAPGFKSLIPLSELITTVYGMKMIQSKKVWSVYDLLLKEFKSEYNILLNVSHEDLIKVCEEKLAKVIIKNREGKIKIKPGYDGVYGKFILED